MAKNTVTIIIPSYNRAHLLPRTIPHFAQEHVVEILIVDDCSTDNTKEVVRNLQKKYPILKYIKAPHKVRQMGAKNIGIQYATGDYCCFGDDDCILKPGTISRLLKICQENEQVIAGARHLVLKKEEDLEKTLKDDIVFPYKGIDEVIDNKDIIIRSYKKYDRIIEVPFCMQTFMLPTAIAKQQQFYEGYKGTCNREETDYQMQVCINFGFKILLDNEALSIDLPRTTSSGGIRTVKSYKRHILEIRNEYYFWKRNRSHLAKFASESANPYLRAFDIILKKLHIK